MLEKRVGLEPSDILHAPLKTLHAIARHGGANAADERAKRLGAAADRVVKKWNGDLSRVLRLPLVDARRELMKYPAIGGPGAERILLLAGAQPVLGLDSNALRGLQRLGFGDERAPWSQGYRDTQAAADADLPRTVPIRRRAYLLLKHHGQTVCRRSAPHCPQCPLLDDCPAGRDA